MLAECAKICDKNLTETSGADKMSKIGTVLVIAQMALLSLGYNVSLALTCGLFAAIAWTCHAHKTKDMWLAVTNICVGGFAIWGLI
jgi:hypothetical protein